MTGEGKTQRVHWDPNMANQDLLQMEGRIYRGSPVWVQSPFIHMLALEIAIYTESGDIGVGIIGGFYWSSWSGTVACGSEGNQGEEKAFQAPARASRSGTCFIGVLSSQKWKEKKP